MSVPTSPRTFIEFALAHDVLRFGEFTLKSGRTSPYFFNLGALDTGARLAELGGFYAAGLVETGWQADVVFGPAYKGIPIAAATVVQLAERHGVDLPWCVNRKEAKEHGEGGRTLGAPLGGQVVVVDDVITAGTAIRETVDLVREAGAAVRGVVVSIDRQERGTGELSAVQEVERDLGVPVHALVTLDGIVAHLRAADPADERLAAMLDYRDRYGIA